MKKRPIEIDGETGVVILTKGYTAIIDASDADAVGQWNWTAHTVKSPCGSVRSVYAVRRIGKSGKRVFMHRFLIDAEEGFCVDHADGDSLNNRRGNLRLATMSQNQMNKKRSASSRSGVKGVYYDPRRSKWVSRIKVSGIRKHLGEFDLLGDAARAYACASKKMHGDFGRTDNVWEEL